MKLRTSCLFLILGFAFVASCGAQKISLYYVQLNGPKPAFGVNDPMILYPAGSSLPENLRVRVFFAPLNVLLKSKKDKSGCIPFYGMVFHRVLYPSTITIDPVSNYAVQIVSPKVTLVFETGDEPDSDTFWLTDHAAVVKYFAHAVEIPLNLSARGGSQATLSVMPVGGNNANLVATRAPAAAQQASTPAHLCFDVQPNPNSLNALSSQSSLPADPYDGLAPTIVATMAPTGCKHGSAGQPVAARPMGF